MLFYNRERKYMAKFIYIFIQSQKKTVYIAKAVEIWREIQTDRNTKCFPFRMGYRRT